MKTQIYQSDIDSYHNEFYIETTLSNIEDTINLFDRLIHDDNIPFDNYIDILNKIYNININENDLFKISSIILGGTASEVILDTDITYDITRRTEKGSVFTYNDEPHKLYLKVAYIDSIDTTHKYTYNELIEMVNNKKIVILDFVLDEESDDYCNNEIIINELMPLSNVISHNFTNLKYLRNDYIPDVYSFLKSYFTTDKLKEDLHTYLNVTTGKLTTTENHINDVLTRYYSRIKKYDTINKYIEKMKRKISER